MARINQFRRMKNPPPPSEPPSADQIAQFHRAIAVYQIEGYPPFQPATPVTAQYQIGDREFIREFRGITRRETVAKDILCSLIETRGMPTLPVEMEEFAKSALSLAEIFLQMSNQLREREIAAVIEGIKAKEEGDKPKEPAMTLRVIPDDEPESSPSEEEKNEDQA